MGLHPPAVPGPALQMLSRPMPNPGPLWGLASGPGVARGLDGPGSVASRLAAMPGKGLSSCGRRESADDDRRSDGNPNGLALKQADAGAPPPPPPLPPSVDLKKPGPPSSNADPPDGSGASAPYNGNPSPKPAPGREPPPPYAVDRNTIAAAAEAAGNGGGDRRGGVAAPMDAGLGLEGGRMAGCTASRATCA